MPYNLILHIYLHAVPGLSGQYGHFIFLLFTPTIITADCEAVFVPVKFLILRPHN